MSNAHALAVGYRLGRDILGMKGNQTFESLEKAAGYVAEYAPVIDSDVNINLPAINSVAGGKTVYDLRPEMFKKAACTKEKMGEWLIEIGRSLKFANDLLKIANSTISRLQSSTIQDKKSIITLQEEVISIKNEQLQNVSSTVQSEMKSYCDIVKKSCSESVVNVTQERLTKAVKTAVEEDDRSKNLVVFGLKEEKEENLTAKIEELFTCVGEKPCVLECARIGVTSEDSLFRPVKIMLRSSNSVHQILRKSGKLRGSENFKTVYFSPDRTREERAAHQQLVLQLKEKIKTDPTNYHFIRSGTVMSKPKN